MAITDVRRRAINAAMADPILTDPVAFASFKQLDIDPSLYAHNIALDADTTREIESSGGWNLTNLTTTARGDYQITKDTLPTLLQGYLNTATEEGIELPTWMLEAADAYTEKAVTKDNLPRLLQSYMNKKFADGEEIPQWALDIANATEVTGNEKQEWNDKGISHFVGSSVGDVADLTEAQRNELTPERDKLMRGDNSITDPMDLEPWQQRVLYANGKNRSINENGDSEAYKEAIEQGDTNVFTDVYMDHWHRGNRFSEAQLNAMPDGGARVRAEVEAARNRATEKYTEAKPEFFTNQDSNLNNPDNPPSNPAVELGNLNIEDYDPESAPLGERGFDFDKANRGMLSEITDLPRRKSGAEILTPASVDARRKSGAEILREQQAQSSRVDPTPPPLPPRGQAEPRIESELAAAQAEAMVPDDDWVAGPNAILEEPKPSDGKRGWMEPVAMTAEKPELSNPAELSVDMSAVFQAARAQSEKDRTQKQGIVRSVMEGATFDLYDEASAYLESKQTGLPYEIARAGYNLEQEKFEQMNPNLSMGLELTSSLVPGVGGFKALETASKMVNRARQTRRVNAGKESITYQPNSKVVVRKGADGKPERVTVFPDPKPVTIAEDLGNGRVLIKDGNLTYPVNRTSLAKQSTRAEVEAASNATLGVIEGGFWGFNAGEDGDRIQSAVVGGVAGLAMGKAIDMFKAPKYNNIGSEADDEMMAISGKYMPDTVQSIRMQAGRALQEAQDARANPIQDDGVAAMFGEAAPAPAPFSYLDQFTESPLAKKEKRTGLAGTWDSAVEKYKEVALGVSDRIMLDFSPQWGARLQTADETALRTLAREVSVFVDPITDVLDLEIKDLHFRGMMLDYAKGEQSLEAVKAYVRQELGEDMAQKFQRYIIWADGKNQQHIMEVTGRSYDAPSYLSTRLSPKKKAEKGTMDRDFDLPDDPGLMSRSRGNYKDNKIDEYDVVDPSDYMPVLSTNMRRIMNNERLVQISRKMNMPTVKNMETADDFFAAMERHVIDMGLDADLARRGSLLVKENLVGQIRSPAQWIQALNSFGYATTLAGPMSALLNLHDPMVASVKYGFRNTMKGAAQPAYDVRGRGIDQNVGEFMNKVVDMYSNDRAGFEAMIADAARNGTDWLMKGSGFAAMDNMGKSGTIKAILNHASEVAAKDSKTKWKNAREQFTDGRLARQWGFYFNKAELAIIQKELMKHGSDFTKYSGQAGKLLEELGFAGLGQQQLISGMGRPASWARHPNLRPMWALRGFAIKQQALIMREIMFNIANGRTDEALKFMARYIALAAGSFGLLNESRQWVFGDGEASFPGFIQSAADQVVSTLSLNTVGLNDYQYGRLMESGPIPVLAESLLPLPATRAWDIGKATYQGITDPTKPLRTEVINETPILRQPFNAIQNLAENTDIVPQPLEDLEKRIRPGEQR